MTRSNHSRRSLIDRCRVAYSFGRAAHTSRLGVLAHVDQHGTKLGNRHGVFVTLHRTRHTPHANAHARARPAPGWCRVPGLPQRFASSSCPCPVVAWQQRPIQTTSRGARGLHGGRICQRTQLRHRLGGGLERQRIEGFPFALRWCQTRRMRCRAAQRSEQQPFQTAQAVKVDGRRPEVPRRW